MYEIESYPLTTDADFINSVSTMKLNLTVGPETYPLTIDDFTLTNKDCDMKEYDLDALLERGLSKDQLQNNYLTLSSKLGNSFELDELFLAIDMNISFYQGSTLVSDSDVMYLDLNVHSPSWWSRLFRTGYSVCKKDNLCYPKCLGVDYPSNMKIKISPSETYDLSVDNVSFSDWDDLHKDLYDCYSIWEVPIDELSLKIDETSPCHLYQDEYRRFGKDRSGMIHFSYIMLLVAAGIGLYAVIGSIIVEIYPSCDCDCSFDRCREKQKQRKRDCCRHHDEEDSEKGEEMTNAVGTADVVPEVKESLFQSIISKFKS
ncbi:hypothetical protein ADUPG1_010439 [Aduncisulcus paluster]|uniref:Uncharacterized protein n=1 Tax=Aduncisulcus paluster TaxID=2918883 RepID=A0ABQ5JRD9_9EUKA|nr:hypothetical protein ADUPG1_010439 [Aduncisulcus paluster]